MKQDYIPLKDSSVKKPIDMNVYEAAKFRIKRCIKLFDNVVVSFSGGKDSLAVLNLVEECYKELGIKEKVNVQFRDEEIIPPAVVEFVDKMYRSGKYNFLYFAYPMKSNKFLMGKTYEYVQWDKDRKWVRQPPEYAIMLDDEDYYVYDQYNFQYVLAKYFKGTICDMNGMRASESLNRLRSCLAKPKDTYLNQSPVPRIMACKPIYDWDEYDIFLYFYKNNIQYCKQYDNQMWNREDLRVATPLHAEAAKSFLKLKSQDPNYYNAIMEVFPEMEIQTRYWKDYDSKRMMDKYPHTFRGLMKAIDIELGDDPMGELAKFRFTTAFKTRRNKIAKNPKDYLGSYPLYYLFNVLFTGGFKRGIPHEMVYTLDDFLFEGYSEREYEKYVQNGNKLI